MSTSTVTTRSSSRDYDRFRYQNERHLPGCIEALNVNGKKVLEIGLGEGSDSERLIREGPTGPVLTLPLSPWPGSRARLTLRKLPYDELRQGSVLDLPFAEGTFDMVFSHGVLHHVPEIDRSHNVRSTVFSARAGNWSS